MRDLTTAASMILTDIDCHVVKNTDQRHRNHLGASEIGDECQRKLWYKFRWVKLKKFAGRMLRLFDRGSREEAYFCHLLRQAGWTVVERDPETDKQFRFTRWWGHFGGSMDALGLPPERSQYAWLGWVVLEFKTAADKYHKKLFEGGVYNEQPKHDGQMHLYGTDRGVEHAVYLSVDKDNDQLYCEVLPINHKRAAELEQKAYQIIFSADPPPKIHDDPTWWKCKMCDFHGVCHRGEKPDVNCRSCAECRPGEDARWWCDTHARYLEPEEITQEHPCWRSIVASS
jgi:hypothetical protein